MLGTIATMKEQADEPVSMLSGEVCFQENQGHEPLRKVAGKVKCYSSQD